MAENDLYDTSNFYAIGHYQGAINEATTFNNAQLTEANKILKEVYIQRSHLAKGNYDYVLQQYVDKQPSQTDFQIILEFCKYLKNPSERNEIIQRISDFSTTPAVENLTFQTLAGQMFYLENELEKALQLVSRSSGKTFLHLEQMALKIQIFLKIGRVDHAEKTIRQMQSIDVDHSLTQLSMAWIYLKMNNPEKVGEATSIFRDLLKTCSTPLLQNGLGVCLMQEKNWEEAEKAFLTVLESRWEDENALSNLIVTSTMLKKLDQAQRYTEQLNSVKPDSDYLKRLKSLEVNFEESVKKYKQ